MDKVINKAQFERWVQVQELRKYGYSFNNIGKELGISWQAVQQHYYNVSPPVRSSHENKISVYRHYHKMRVRILEFLGGECIKCGFSDYRALQIDHVNGGGSKDVKKLGGTYHMYREIIDMINSNIKIEKYQLLCANCNWIKRHEKNEIAHGKHRDYSKFI